MNNGNDSIIVDGSSITLRKVQNLKLVTSAFGFLLVLLATARRGMAAERTFWLLALPYTASRLVTEFYRSDPCGMILSLPTPQKVSVVLMPLSIVMLWRLRVLNQVAAAVSIKIGGVR